MKIIVNRVRCKKCGSIIESKHTYDYKQCHCGSIAVDGGKDYQKVTFPVGAREDDYIDFSYSEYVEVKENE